MQLEYEERRDSIFWMLIEMGLFDEEQMTQLLIAVCKNQRYELAHALVKQGATMPLFFPNDNLSFDISPSNIQFLLAAGIDINQVNSRQVSPLLLACRQLDEASLDI